MQRCLWKLIDNFLELKLNTKHSRDGYLSRFKEWCRFLGGIWGTDTAAELIRNATGEHVENYIKLLRKRTGQNSRTPGVPNTVSDSTIDNKLTAITSIYNYLVRKDFTPHNPVYKAEFSLKPKRYRKRPTSMIPYEKVEEMIYSIDIDKTCFRDRAYIALSFGAGLRRGEIHQLRVGNVKWAQNGNMYVVLTGTKNNIDENQAVAPFAHMHINQYLEQRRYERATENDFLFAKPNGDQLNYYTLYHRFRSALLRVGLCVKQHSPHSTRATGITKLLDDGLSHRQVQEFSRHASVEMVEVYDKRRRCLVSNPANNLKFH